MSITVSKVRARKIRAALHDVLAEGFAPPGKCTRGSNAAGAVFEAARRLGEQAATVRNLVKPAGALDRMGFGIDWKRYRAPAPKPATAMPAEPTDPILVRRLTDRSARAEARATEAERRALAAESLRSAVFGLAETPLDPPAWTAGQDKDGHFNEAIVLFVSDVHMGETIDIKQMGGRNSYDQAIAAARLERLFARVVKLGTRHWSGPPPGVIYLVLGGDLVSGEIHDELAKTNDLLAIPAVRRVTECFIAGVTMLLKHFACPIHIVSVPGNHGRTTKKPESKAFALNSYDTLVAWCLEAHFAARAEKRVTFAAPASGDALVNIAGWNILFTHGDRIGSRGGAGFVGVAATAARGFKRLIMDYAAEGTVVDAIVIGHFHTDLELEEGFVNGSLVGPSDYSRSGRMRSHPASQWMLSVHPVHGIARRWKIQVGDPSEGSIYKGRA